jgi:hypothetical protein
VKRVVTLVVEYSEDFDQMGLLPANAPPTFYPMSAMGAAHDVVEHVHGGPEMGTLHDEMMAFGVIHWIRGRGGFWDKQGCVHTSAAHHTHAEIVDFFGAWFSGKEDRFDKPPADAAMADVEEVEETIAQIRDYARETTVHTYDGETIVWDLLEEHVPDIEAWLRIGYAWAEERFDGHYAEEVCDAFIALMRKLEEVIEDLEDYPGTIVEVAWDDETLEFSVDTPEALWRDA